MQKTYLCCTACPNKSLPSAIIVMDVRYFCRFHASIVMNDMHKFAILVYTDRVVQLSVTHLINFNLQAANHKFAINAMGCFQLK